MNRYALLATTFLTLLCGGFGVAQASGELSSFSPKGLKLELSHIDTATPDKGEVALRPSSQFAGALGLQVASSIWIEGEMMNRRMDAGAGFSDAQVALVNVSYQPRLGKITPFLSAGAGVSHHDGRISDSGGFTTGKNDGGNGFAWQLGGGVQFDATPDLSFAGAYRYLSADAPGPLPPSADPVEDHEFWVRAKYDMPVKRQQHPLAGSRLYNE